jgi:hypothetical protein
VLRHRRLAALLALAVLVTFGGASSALGWRTLQDAPEGKAGEVQIAQLEFTPGQPRAVTIYPGNGSGVSGGGTLESGRLYWYLPYTVENKSAKAGSFFVTCRAYSDKGRRYSDLALPFVEERVEKMEQRPLFSKADLLAQGEGIGAYVQYAPGDKKECVAIFNPIDPEADRITIEVHGLIDDIEIQELAGGGFKVTERVLVLTYARPGDEFYTALDSFEFKGREWQKRTTETPAK